MRAKSLRLLASLSVVILIVFWTTKTYTFSKSISGVTFWQIEAYTTYGSTIWSPEESLLQSQSLPESQQQQSSQYFGTQTRQLQDLGLSHDFEYRHLCISAAAKEGLQRSSLYDVDTRFFEKSIGDTLTSLQLSDNQLLACHPRMTVNVPTFDYLAIVDTSMLMLGMATTLNRFSSSLLEISQWLSRTNTVLQVLITDDADVQELQTRADETFLEFGSMEMNIMLHFHRFPAASDGLKNFALAEVLRDNRAADTKWFGVIDDDTFFVSLQQMVLALESYNATELLYIGSLSEGLTRIAKEGFKAWGGAGFFLSAPLLAIVAEHAEDCRRLDQGFGDLLWRDCIVEYTSPTATLTQLEGLNQLDIWKDASGWYESAHNPLYTIHHWKSWHYHPVPAMHLVTKIAGPDVLLQRYRFTDDTVLHNGYSLVHYPQGVPDLAQAELTMVEDVGIEEYPGQIEFLHSMGKTRTAMVLGETKIQWKLETSFAIAHNTVSQIYVKRADTGQGQDMDSVIQIDWQNI